MKVKDLSDLKARQKAAMDYRESLYKDADWREYEDYWMAKYPNEEGILCVPVLVSDAQRQMASLTGATPMLELSTNQPELIPAARVIAAQLNQLARNMKIADQMQDAVQDAITLGTGFLLDGYGSQYGTSYSTANEGIDDSRYDDKYHRIEYHENIQDNMPWTLRAHPSDILVPSGTIREADCSGFWHRYIRHIDDVKADEKYMKKHRAKLKPDVNIADTTVGMAGSFNRDVDLEHVILQDFYNYKDSKRTSYNENYGFAMADDVDEIMIRIDRLPLHSIIFNRNSRMFWGTSDFNFQEDNAKEINDIRTAQVILRNLQKSKGFYDKNMLEDETDMENFEKALASMTSDEAMALIGINGDPTRFIQQFTPHQMPDMTAQLQLCKSEIQEFGLGVGPHQRGQMAPGRHTKYETQVAEGGFDMSLTPRLKVIRDVYIEIFKNWSELIFEFWDEPQQIQTYDAMGNQVVVEFKGADLRGDYRFKISLDSMRAKNQQQRTEEANMILAQTMPGVQMGVVDPRVLYRQYLSRLNSDWDIDSLVPMPQQPQSMPFSQYQQQFGQQMPQNEPGIAQLMGQLGGQIG